MTRQPTTTRPHKTVRIVGGRSYQYWCVRYRDPGSGRPKTRYFASKREADAACDKMRTDFRAGTFNEDAYTVTVREVAKRWVEANYAPRKADVVRATTKASYELGLKAIRERWGAVRLNAIRTSDVERWRDELLAAGKGRSTVRNALLVFGILYRFAMRDHLVTFNPVALVRKPAVGTRKREALQPSQLPALFEKLTGRARIVVKLAALCGLREGEIFGLRWQDVDLAARTVLVARQYTHGEFGDVKTNAGRRTVGLDATLAAELAAWKLSREPDHKQPGSLVVATANGGPLSASNFLSRDLYPALDRAKLPRVGLHSLRHTFVTALRSSDAPIGVVHQILGHANYATTAKLYGSVTDAALTAAADAAAAAFVPNVHKPGTTDSVAS